MKYQPKPLTVLLAAAGGGSRMGGVYKPLLKLNGRQAVLYSLDAFMQCDFVERVVISARREELYMLREICARENYPKEILVTPGGTTRNESITLAFRAAFENRPKTKFTATHDAARPLITVEEITHAYELACRYGNAACAAKAKDTCILAEENGLIDTHIDRSRLWHIQTPQIFDTDMLEVALATAIKESIDATDETFLVRRAGFLVKLSETSHNNLKLTYPEDVAVAEAILSERAKKQSGHLR